MESQSPIKKAGFEITEDLKYRFDVEVKKRRLKVRDALRQALEAWLGGDSTRGEASTGETIIQVQGKVPTAKAGESVVESQFAQVNSKLDLLIGLLDGLKHGQGDRDREWQDTAKYIRSLAEQAKKLGLPLGKLGESGEAVRKRPQKPLRRA